MIEPDRHSMAAEVLLNLTKSLEILFTDDRDTLRTRAKTWGIPVKEIEQKIIPIFLLRNEIDVAHVSTGHLNKQERHTIFGFTVAAIDNVQQILLPIYEKVISDQIVLEPVSYSLTSHKKKLLADIKEYLNHN
jgi:hypothetical protein